MAPGQVWEFGGTLLRKSHAKIRRPISTKQKMLVVFSTSAARGPRSFHFFQKPVQQRIQRAAKIHHLKVYDVLNGGHHLQLVVKTSTRKDLQNFIRSLSGTLARLILKAEKGRPQKLSLWTQRPYTRWLPTTNSPLQNNWAVQDRLLELGLLLLGRGNADFFSSS